MRNNKKRKRNLKELHEKLYSKFLENSIIQYKKYPYYIVAIDVSSGGIYGFDIGLSLRYSYEQIELDISVSNINEVTDFFEFE